MRTETITLYKERKEALASTRVGHVEKEFNLISDEVGEDGVRVIRMKPKDLTELNKIKNEVVDAIAKKVGDEGKVFKKILLDTLGDYNESSIRRIHSKVVLGKVPVKASPGCFEIIIGDGRKKTADIIRIRE